KYIQNKNLGLNKEQTIAIRNIPSLVQNKYMIYKNEVLKIPGITGVSASMDEPSKQIRDGGNFEAEGIQQDEENRKIIYALPVDGNIIDFFSMEMVAGEKFTPGPWNDSIDTYILNQTAVNTIGWKNPQEAIGKTFRLQLGVPEAYQPKKGKIIGVVKDFNFSTLHKKVKPMVLFQKSYWVFCILVKVQPDKIQENISTLEKKWSEMFPQYAFEYSFVDDLFADIYLSEQKQGKIVGIFSSLAVFIACLGLFGLAAFTTEQRTKEIGIRKVMGASVSGIVLLLSKEFTKCVFFANIIAWPIAWFLMDSWLENFAYKIELELWMFIFTGCLALFIALITVIFQAVKAAIANPVKALKYE
ncbi:MAG: ABC transporter permease, partial [Calditrichia bacterium]|nr:ABC transporter permease [Calditrichia bacterium]